MAFWKEPKPLLRSPDNYIPAVNTLRFVKGHRRVLLVGDAYGREYRLLSQHGFELHCLDVAPQAGIPNVLLQSIEDRTPFPDQFFDAVVVNEVLEHLARDADALVEVRRVLADDGVLVVTVPYLSKGQDDSEFHVRVHTPKTISRLLNHCGFQIREHFCRGWISRMVQLSPVIRVGLYSAMKLTELFTRCDPDTAVDRVNRQLEQLERRLGSGRLQVIQRHSRGYGGILCATKTAPKDFNTVQRRYFSDQPAT